MFCKECGTKIPDDAQFCPFCGEVLELEAESPQEKPIVDNKYEDDFDILLDLFRFSTYLFLGIH